MNYPDLSLLVVDDEDDILEIYDDLFSSQVGKVIRARSGFEAFEIVKNQNIDAIISDISMPQMTGLELLEKVRGLNKGIPFLIVTGFGDKQTAVSALRLGAFDFLDKPFDLEKMKKTVAAALESAQQLRHLNAYLSKLVQAMNPEKQIISKSEELIARLTRKS